MILTSVLALLFSSAFSVQGGSYGKFDVFKLDPSGQLNPVALNQDLVPNQPRNPTQYNHVFYGNNKNEFPYVHDNNIRNNNGDQVVIAVIDDGNNNMHREFEKQFNKVTSEKNTSPYEIVIIEEQFKQNTDNKKDNFYNTKPKNAQENSEDYETILNENINNVFGNGQRGSENSKPAQSDNLGNFFNENQNSYTQYHQQGGNNDFNNQEGLPCNPFLCVRPPPSYHGPSPLPYSPPPHGPFPPHGYPPHEPLPHWGPPGGYQQGGEHHPAGWQHSHQEPPPQQWGVHGGGNNRPPPPPNPPKGGVNPLSSSTEPSGDKDTLILDDSNYTDKVKEGNLSTSTIKNAVTSSTMTTPYKPDIDVRFGRDDSIVFPDD